MSPESSAIHGYIFHESTAKRAEFCSYVFKGKKTSQLKIDVIFQIMHDVLNDGKGPTPC